MYLLKATNLTNINVLKDAAIDLVSKGFAGQNASYSSQPPMFFGHELGASSEGLFK